MTLYKFDSLGFFCGTEFLPTVAEVREDGTYTVPPPYNKGQRPRWNGQAWEIVSIVPNVEAVIPSRIKEARLAKKISQSQLANLTGISQSGIAKYEKGVYSPTIRTLAVIATTLNVSADWLIGISEIKER